MSAITIFSQYREFHILLLINFQFLWYSISKCLYNSRKGRKLDNKGNN